MSSLNEQSVYSETQLSDYLACIFRCSKKSFNLSSIKSSIISDPLGTLALIQLRHLCSIPWNSVALHYSSSKSVSVSPSDIFTKLVTRGSGGYCMETNILLATVLRSLGYDLYVTGARISSAIDLGPNGQPEPGFRGFEHMVIFVFIHQIKYHVDVGFANFGPLRPMVLQVTPEGLEVPGPPGVLVRLRHRSIPNNTQQEQKYWVLETQNAGDRVWKDGYAFTELEFLAQDFRNMNFRTHRDPASWFTFTVICTRVLAEDRDEDGGTQAVGTVTLVGDTLTRRLGPNKAETVTLCRSEKERVAVLKEWFGIHLTNDDVNGITGTTTEIKQAPTSEWLNEKKV